MKNAEKTERRIRNRVAQEEAEQTEQEIAYYETVAQRREQLRQREEDKAWLQFTLPN